MLFIQCSTPCVWYNMCMCACAWNYQVQHTGAFLCVHCVSFFDTYVNATVDLFLLALLNNYTKVPSATFVNFRKPQCRLCSNQ